MRAYILIAVLFTLHFKSAGQDFDFFIPTNSDHRINTSEEMSDAYVLLNENKISTDSSIYSLITVSTSGEINNTLSISDANFEVGNMAMKNDTIYVIGKYLSGEGISTIMLKVYDKQLNLVNKRKTEQNITGFTNVKIKFNSKENLLFFGGRNFPDGSFKPFIIEISKEGQLINSLFINNSEGLINDVLEYRTKKGYFAITFNTQFTAHLIERLELSDELELTTVQGVNSQVPYNTNLMWINDTTYILSGRILLWDSRNMALEKYSETHQLIEQKEIVNEDFRDNPGGYKNLFPSKTEDETFFFSGTSNVLGYDYFYQEEPSFIAVYKMNFELEVINELFYGGENFYFNVCGNACKDGGILLCNTMYDFNSIPEYDAHVIKLDAQLDPLSTTEEAGLNASELILYPNPGNAELNVRTAVQALGGEFILYNTNGKLLQQCTINRREQEINTSKIPTGQYIWKYQKPDGTQESGIWIKQ